MRSCRLLSGPDCSSASAFTLARAALTAERIRSSSIGTSDLSTTLGSICTRKSSPRPLAVTLTIPPPASPLTCFCASASCALRSWSEICCACWKIWLMSKPAIASLLAQVTDIFDLAAENFHRCSHGRMLAAKRQPGRLRAGTRLLLLAGERAGGWRLRRTGDRRWSVRRLDHAHGWPRAEHA